MKQSMKILLKIYEIISWLPSIFIGIISWIFQWVVPMKTHSFMGHENFHGFPWVFDGT